MSGQTLLLVYSSYEGQDRHYRQYTSIESDRKCRYLWLCQDLQNWHIFFINIVCLIQTISLWDQGKMHKFIPIDKKCHILIDENERPLHITHNQWMFPHETTTPK